MGLVLGALMLAVPFVGIVGLILWVAGRRRDFLRAREQAATQVGWFPAPPNPWLSDVAAGIFQRGRPGVMVTGDFRGRGMCALDYTYTTSNGKTTTTHQVHLVALNLPVALPALTVTRDSKLRRVFGGPDVELESQAFNDAFRVNCPDARFASAVLHPRMMEWQFFNPGLQWLFAGNALVSWGSGSWVVPDVQARLEAMNSLIDLIPPFVLRDYGQPRY